MFVICVNTKLNQPTNNTEPQSPKMFHNHINYVSKLQITTIITKSIPSEKSACSLYDCTTYSTQEASSESQ